MSYSKSTVYLVSGANRGLGLSFVKALAQRDNVVVFAGAREPDAASALTELSSKHPGKVHIVKLVSCDVANNAAVADEIKAKAGRIDVVIANAAISSFFAPISQTPPEQLREHFEVNTVGTLVLFQSVQALLRESIQAPKFVVISSGAGSVFAGPQMPVGSSSYGMSKAAVNFMVRKLHFENEHLICFPICPGGVATDMADFAIKSDAGMKIVVEKHPAKDPYETALAVLSQIDSATRKDHGGQFLQWDGSRWEW